MLRLTVVAVLLLALASCGTADSSSSSGRVIRTDASYSFDPSDPQALVGASTEIFFGKVVSGPADAIYPNGDTLPLTEFRVATTDIVKGDPGSTVSVFQQAGRIKGSEDRTIFEGDALLDRGREYLFFVNDESGKRLIIPVLGNQIVDSADAKSKLKAKYQ